MSLFFWPVTSHAICVLLGRILSSPLSTWGNLNLLLTLLQDAAISIISHGLQFCCLEAFSERGLRAVPIHHPPRPTKPVYSSFPLCFLARDAQTEHVGGFVAAEKLRWAGVPGGGGLCSLKRRCGVNGQYYPWSTACTDPVSLPQAVDASAESRWKMTIALALRRVSRMKPLANLRGLDPACCSWEHAWGSCAVCPVADSVPICL